MDSGTKTLFTFLLHHPSTKFIRLQFVDLSGILRTRIVTTQHCLDMIAKGQHATVGGKSMLFSVTDKTSSTVASVGLCELHPDWRSLRVCGYAPGHAAVMCCVYDRYFEEEPFHLCPRRKLADFVIECEVSQSKKFLVGFEVEFVLLDPSGEPPRTVDPINAWSVTNGFRGDTLKLMEESVEALQASGISVLQFHTVEPNQLQIATGPLSPLDAIDALMHTNECIKHVSVRHGLRATMAPKPLREDMPTATHAHVSIHPPSGQENFLAGILNSLQTLCAFGLPSYDSYSRITELRNAAGAWVAWGTENRYVPIRAIENARWELRYLDTTANFYLALLTAFSAGMQGLKENMPLL